jgi:hypothetical protein
MGQADWGTLDDVLAVADLARGVTAGIVPPSGGGSFVYGYNTRSDAVGAHGKFVNLATFNPTGGGLTPPAGGGSITGCSKRVASVGNVGMSPMLYFCLEPAATPTVNDWAYILGLSDADPYHIVLAKGPLVGGLVDDAADLTILRTSSAQYSMGDDLWHHLRLDAIVEPNGDVLLKVFENDLVGHPIGTAPTWVAIPGMADFIDDALEINSGSAPLWGGYAGFAFATNGQIGRRGAFDAITVERLT